MRPRRDVVDFNMTSAPREHLRHFTFSPVATSRPPTSSGPTPLPSLPHSPSLSAAASGAKTGAAEDNIATGLVEEATDGEKTAAPHYEQALGDDWTWGMAVGGKTPATATGQQSRHLKETSARSSPARWWRRSIARQDVEGGRTTFGSNSSSTVDEHHVESLGSTLNRQASVLMLLYPAAYCLLFSVSIIRIITDLADPAPGHRPKDPNGALRAISRWFVFAQGAFDAIIFQIVERQFRSRMKRRRQKAAGEAVDPSILSRVRNFFVPSTAR
ncbi:Glucose receptor Git3, C-terminal [Ceraceosorus bombacis]|uniref:Glucose receptor Git3, C-terminal n=1 Tax=Ceraceosorus bombacis TaxID=401625 RepID=A0A0P1BL72_9BASI|nr:Glucose receptor Git3, C-terminal [Ceraceosorus bombacis]